MKKSIAALSAILAGLLVVVAAWAGLLEPSGLNSRFPFSDQTSFKQYCRKMAKVIVQARKLGPGPGDQTVLAANRPYELTPKGRPPYRRGIIILHGLTDSPYILKPLARHFHEQGFLVRGLLLPGHGTVPGDLREVDYQAWEKAVAWAVKRTRPKVKELFLCGFSTGGALAVEYAVSHPEEIRAMVLISPALKIKSALAWATVPLKQLKKWLTVRENLDYARYESFAMNAAGEVWRLSGKVRNMAEGKELAAPSFMVVSGSDQVIDADYALSFFSRHLTNPLSRAISYDDHRPPPADRRIIITPAAVADEKILDYSHLSPPMPPDDPHYGRNGDYRTCYHYLRSSKRRECREGRGNFKGAVSLSNLWKGTLERLSYNPRYDEMIARLDTFLAAVSQEKP